MWRPDYTLGVSTLCFVLMGCAYYKQNKMVLFPSGAVFVVFTAAATFLVWTPVHAAAPAAILAVTLLAPLAGLLLFLIDYVFAVFSLEMRYLVIAWWVLPPLSIPINAFGLWLNSVR